MKGKLCTEDEGKLEGEKRNNDGGCDAEAEVFKLNWDKQQ